MPNWELYAEAERRGILPPDKKVLYEEAKRRGLTGKPAAEPFPTTISETTRPLEPEPPREEGSYLAQMGANVLPSAVNYLKGIVTPLLSPVETAQGIGLTALGGIEKLIPGEQEHEQYADALVGFLKDRYGGLENIKKTIRDDPVGALGDISAVLTGAGGLARMGLGVGTTAGKVAGMVSKVGRYMEPIGGVAKLTAMGVKPLAVGPISSLLGFSTGLGSEVMKKSVAPTSEVMRAVRGKAGSIQDVAERFKKATTEFREAAGREAEAAVGQIGVSKRALNIAPLKQEFMDLLDQFNMSIDPTTKKLLFHGDVAKGREGIVASVRSASDRRVMREIFDDVMNYGRDPKTKRMLKGGLTPEALYYFKRQLSKKFAEHSDTRAIVRGLEKKIDDIIASSGRVPEYRGLMEKMSKNIRLGQEIESALNTGNNKTMRQAIRGVHAVFQEDNEFVRSLAQFLEKQPSGKGLLDELAGVQLRRWTPYTGPHAGLAGRLLVGSIFGLVAGLGLNTAMTALSTSPRLVTEIAYKVAQASKIGGKRPSFTLPGLFEMRGAAEIGAGKADRELEQARIAISKGRNPDQVKRLYRERTGKEFPE